MRDNKLNKQRRHRKNEELKKDGRTSRQISLKKMKEAISNYLIQYPKYKFPPTFNIDLKYFHMNRMIDDENKRLREEAEALKIKQEQEEKRKKEEELS